MSFCILCGKETIGEDHDKSDGHQLAGAVMLIDIADNMKSCPWCPGKKGLKNLKDCTVSEHAEKLAYCRQLVGEKRESMT
jgi:hypothetical protein